MLQLQDSRQLPKIPSSTDRSTLNAEHGSAIKYTYDLSGVSTPRNVRNAMNATDGTNPYC